MIARGPFSGPLRDNLALARTASWLGLFIESSEETDNPVYADDRNFYKVEKWSRDRMKIDSLLYAGNNLGKAQGIFANEIKRRPRIRLTIRQRTRVLQQWPIEGGSLPSKAASATQPATLCVVG